MAANSIAPLPCIICGFQPKPVAGDLSHYNQPDEATVFISHGHYGSTVWDPAPYGCTDWIELNICDECLVARKERVLRVSQPHTPRPEPKTRPWEPEEA